MTLTALARAVSQARFSRWLCIVAFCAGSSAASGQRTGAPARRSATTPAAAPARWDTLYSTHRLFELRETVAATQIAASPSVQFYRGIVAHAFNNNDVAISALAPIVDSAPSGITPLQYAAATDALADSYRRVFRYRESANAYASALRRGRPALDSATRSEFTAWNAIGLALANVAPQRVIWSDQANNSIVSNDSVSYALTVAINGDTSDALLGVSATSRVTTLDSTTAAAHSVRQLPGTVSVVLRGVPYKARVGVIERLGIGAAQLANVPVLIVSDASMRSANGLVPLRGFVARPVLAALGTVTFSRDGHIALSSPGVDTDTSTAPSVAFLSNATLVDVIFRDRRAPLLLDMHETRTLLYPGFLTQFPAAVGNATLTTYVAPGRSGAVMSLPAYVIPNLVLTIGGRQVTLAAVHALMRNPDPRAATFMGTLGQDVLQSADRVTVDFSSMTVRFRARPATTVLPQLVYPTNATGATLPTSTVPEDIAFVVLLFALFVIPKALQRYRIASAVTSLVMGAGATALGFFHNDPTLHLLSTFGIVALFLFAGLEIDGHELRRQASPLIVHGLIWSVLLAIGAAVAVYAFGFEVRPALLIALALLTPSTGFILSSLAGFGLLDAERFAVKTYAISSEMLALTALFFILQSTSVTHLAIAVAAMLIVVTVIPLAFRLFARLVAPHAPRSEFAFLLMVAIVAAYATRRLGVYYLVGAFLVGIAAQQFRSELPAMSSEKMVDALESFGSVFIPFYFFRAGTEIIREQLTWRALLVGVALLVVLVPFRVAVTMVQRRFVLRDTRPAARRIGIALIPTLVFTLVIIDILKTNFALQNYILGALVLYTVINTSIPAFVLHSAPPEFESVSAADVEPDAHAQG